MKIFELRPQRKFEEIQDIPPQKGLYREYHQTFGCYPIALSEAVQGNPPGCGHSHRDALRETILWTYEGSERQRSLA